jgi:hypothetical protein
VPLKYEGKPTRLVLRFLPLDVDVERQGYLLGLALSDADTLDFPEGEELGAFDLEGAPEGADDDKLGGTDGVVLGDNEQLGDSLGLALGDADTLGFPEGKELGVFDLKASL